MARGWESKAVEQQIDSAETRRPPAVERPTPEQIEAQRRREVITLSRTRILHDLEATHNPRYRTMLEQALAHLNEQLSHLPE